uniref:flagellin hook IN motif-containing protein n=1 Tax=Campylobacter pinnipediorum TaxID=1965231 RepID=UPI000AED0491
LNGTFSNKEFQIGAYSNQTVKASIGATTSDKIGLTRFESSKLITLADGNKGANVSLTFINVDGINNVKVAATELSYGLGKGLGALAENINKVADQTGIRASFDVTIIASNAITAGAIVGLKINNVIIGDLDVKANDSNGTLVNAINQVKDQTGVEASIDPQGKLRLTSREGRGIVISTTSNKAEDKKVGKRLGVSDKTNLSTTMFVGRLNLVRLDGRDIKVKSGDKAEDGKFSTAFSQTNKDKPEDGGGQ